MNLSKERMDHIDRLVEGGFPLTADEVKDLHGMNYHLYCLCDTYQAMKISAENEAETLKAENASLKTGYEAYERVNTELRAECEALRKDAERYRWFRDQHWNNSVICAVVDPKLTTRLGAYCPSGKRLDDAVDAGISMSKEQSYG